MASSQTATRSDNADMAAKLLEEFRKPDSGKLQVYTSARLLQDFVAGQLLRPGREGCQTHEFLLLPSQSGKSSRDPDVEVVSCVCTKCYHHFRIKVAAGSDVPFGKHHALNMHMFIMSGRDSDMLLKATRDAHDHIIDRTYLICLVDECRCRIEFERLPPRLSTRELDALGDKQRIVRNMREAQSKDAERVKSLGEGFSPNVFEMLKTYLNDGLTADVNAPPRRIKTHNKRFMVAINNDFDDLWRTLGFEKTIVEDGDEAWVFAKLEPPSSPTAFGTLRAKWEDTEAECMLHLDSIPTGPRKIRPAWEMLQRVFGCEKYESTLGTPVRDAADLAILGCLANFKATLYSMAAVLLAEKCPLRWEEFKGAALRLSNDDQEASEALALYESTLDSSPQQYMSDEVDAAYQFFGAHHKERDGDFFIARYYMMLDADSSEGNVKRLQSNIDIVGNFLSKDLVSVVRPESDTSKMDLIRAGSILNDADMTYTEDIMESIVNNKAQDATIDRAAVAEALEYFAQQHQSSNSGFANKLNNWAGIFKSGSQPFQTATTQQADQQALIDPDTPPGLRNIGNTCYLNSLLQYLYTVSAVRDSVLQYPHGSLELDSNSVRQRILGYANGITFNLEEAIVGRQFVEELQLLYSDLQQTTGVSSAPSQKLANTALRSARKLIEAELNNNQVQETTPPPLPVRPSPAPPSTQTSETSNVSVTIEPVNDSMETASAVSSQTLVDDDLAMSAVVPVDTEDTAGKLQEVRSQSAQGQTVLAVSEPTGHGLPEEPTLDEKFQLISQRLEKSDRKGTDQQDVDEVMGFILEHLMRAITSKGPMSGKTDMQADIITDTFFPLIVNYTLKSDENLEKARAELNSDRWINIVPSTRDGGAFSIHDAIVRSWGIQYPESSNLAVFTAIRRLSPVIHIRIARAKEDGTKNNNPIVLTDELYFDRHMDVPHDSEFAGFRKAHWALIGHQAQLESLDNKDPTSITVPESQAFVASNVDHNMLDVTMHCWGEDVTTIEDNIESILSKLPIASTDLSNKRRLSNQDGDQLIPARKKSLTPEAAGTMGQVTMAINQKCLIDERIDEDTVTKDGVEDYFDTLKQHKYRLHAVICHSGGARAGHYWVWIRDFNRNLWIKYNDSTVTIDRRDPQAVIDDLSMSGDPCYVAYVRDEDKDNIVGIPRRSLPPPSGDVEMQTIDGIAPDDHEMPDLVVVTGDKHTVTNNGITEMDDPRPYQLN